MQTANFTRNGFKPHRSRGETRKRVTELRRRSRTLRASRLKWEGYAAEAREFKRDPEFLDRFFPRDA